MALMKCPECGKEISEYTNDCPHCGYPVSRCRCGIYVTELNKTDSFSYTNVAQVMGDWAAYTDAETKLKSLPCTLVYKDSIDKAKKSVKKLEKMGLKCEIQLDDTPDIPQRSTIEYISPETLNNIATFIMIIGSITGLIFFVAGCWDGYSYEWTASALITGVTMVFASIGTGIIVKFMAEILNRLPK